MDKCINGGLSKMKCSSDWRFRWNFPFIKVGTMTLHNITSNVLSSIMLDKDDRLEHFSVCWIPVLGASLF